MPPLAACIRSAAPEHAWPARIVARAAADPRDRAWRDAAGGLAALVADDGAVEANRVIAALSLRGLGSSARAVTDDLVEVLAGDAPPSVWLGGTVVVLELHERLDALDSWSTWEKETAPVVNLLDFLDEIDAHVKP